MQDFARAPHQVQKTAPVPTAPNAALLIDFDNVTMGIRSDLTRELKKLLNSDVIRGKVAVQRAYADWRRYPQYIVPLSESSVDLIFAPAYGSSKKNATDIRLAIDALELVFTRPEIGVFILLSGDSDFSSLVLKLKEYGKYVIGVGLRESSSDLLVQNCDEYYSYSALSGLTKAGEGGIAPAEDPWALVERSVRQMQADGDVMRSDRLKQVMLEFDPNFDEKEHGFTKFNKFITEAASKGALRIRKLENGQYEVSAPDDSPAPGTAPVASRATQPPKPQRESQPARQPAEPKEQTRQEQPKQEQPKQERPAASAPAEDRSIPPEAARAARSRRGVDEADLGHAYDLLRRAVADIVASGNGDAARDSDVKRRILELEPKWDESEVGFSKFSRFLRQAHDAEVINLRKTGEGYYEVALVDGPPKADRARAGRDRAERREKPDRERRESRGSDAPDRSTPARASKPEPEPKPEREPEPEQRAEAAPEPEASKPAELKPAESKPGESKPEAAPEAAPAGGPEPRSALMGRPGSKRGGRTHSGPPPLLPGQVAGSKAGGAGHSEPGTAPGGGNGGGAVSAPAGGSAPAADAGSFDADALGLPTEEGAVIRYLSNSYKGVGKKTAEQLIETFGADGVFAALAATPDRVREVLGAGHRTDQLMDAWEADIGRRRSRAGSSAGEGAEPSSGGQGSGNGRRRGRRGGRRGRSGGSSDAAGQDG